MNPIQRVFLRVLQGPANFMNNNLSKRAGLVGRLSRFWAIGLRDYGVHPSSKLLKSMNAQYLMALKFLFGRQSPMKTLHGKQNYINGYMAMFRAINYIFGFALLSIPFYLPNFFDYKRKIPFCQSN